MRLPFVSRDVYERALDQVAVADAMRELWAALVEKRDAQYHDLLARYHMLRLQGYVPTPVVEAAPRKADPVADAIAQAAGNAPELREMMAAQAAIDRADGKSDADIAAAIYLGQAATDGTFI